MVIALGMLFLKARSGGFLLGALGMLLRGALLSRTLSVILAEAFFGVFSIVALCTSLLMTLFNRLSDVALGMLSLEALVPTAQGPLRPRPSSAGS